MLPDGTLHLGFRLEMQMVSAAKGEPDFFAVTGCGATEDEEVVSKFLAKNALTTERRYKANLKGMPELEEEPSTSGFNIPALIVASPSASMATLAGMCEEAAKSTQICGVAILTKLAEGDIEQLRPQCATT